MSKIDISWENNVFVSDTDLHCVHKFKLPIISI